MILCIHEVERTSSFLSRWSFYAFCPWWMPCYPETTFSSPGFIPSALGKPCWTTVLHCELTLETASTEDVHLTKDKVLWFLEKPHPLMDRCWGIKTRLLCQFRKPLKGHLLFSPSQWSVVVFFGTITTYPCGMRHWTEFHHTQRPSWVQSYWMQIRTATNTFTIYLYLTYINAK